jgi:hypothetical protein
VEGVDHCRRRVIKQTVVIIEAYHFGQLRTKFYPSSCCQGYLHMQRKLLDHQCGFRRNRSTIDHKFCNVTFNRVTAVVMGMLMATA